MFKSPQVASDLLMVLSGHLSWTGNLLSCRQTRIIFLSPHSVIVTSSCALTHVMVTTIPPNGLNLTFPIIAIWPLSPAPTHCSITRSFGGGDCQGFLNPRGFWVGYGGVWVRVRFFNPR